VKPLYGVKPPGLSYLADGLSADDGLGLRMFLNLFCNIRWKARLSGSEELKGLFHWRLPILWLTPAFPGLTVGVPPGDLDKYGNKQI